MPRLRDELTAGEWAILALLAESPTHGFAIARAMAPEGEVGQIWSVRRGPERLGTVPAGRARPIRVRVSIAR